MGELGKEFGGRGSPRSFIAALVDLGSKGISAGQMTASVTCPFYPKKISIFANKTPEYGGRLGVLSTAFPAGSTKFFTPDSQRFDLVDDSPAIWRFDYWLKFEGQTVSLWNSTSASSKDLSTANFTIEFE